MTPFPDRGHWWAVVAKVSKRLGADVRNLEDNWAG
jgi:hypothetical protein